MKIPHLIPLLFLTACSNAPKLALRPQSPPSLADASTIRYPEVIHAYHLGRYADGNNDALMHEQHTVYRVEENSRWDFHPGGVGGNVFPPVPTPRDAAFNPVPVNDEILAEVNSQRFATAQIMGQSRTLAASLAQFQNALAQTRTNWQQTAALRATVSDFQQRLAALEAAQKNSLPTISTTNEPLDSFRP